MKNYENKYFLTQLLLKLRDGGCPLIGRKEHVHTVDIYRNFFNWFVGECLSQLGPQSNFTRRFLSLHFLRFFFFFCDLISRIDGTWFQLGFFRLVQDILGFHNDAEGSKGSQGLNCSQCLTVSSLSSLIDCLFDSFDVNKEMALELLKSPPLLKLMNQVFGYLIDSLFSCYWRRLSIGSIE